jgi:hypothetical protein
MEVNQKNTPNKLSDFVSFIPHRLIIIDHPELAQFSLNLLIGRYTVRNGQPVFGNVLYEPALNSLSQDESGIFMNYLNPLDETSLLKFSVRGESCEVVKYFRGQRIGASFGIVRGLDDNKGWRNFFLHVGLLGFVNGEIVMYDPVLEK